jgi:hypothetical protein
MRIHKAIIILLSAILISLLMFVFVGCGEQNENVPKNGIPILIRKEPLIIGEWKGKLLKSGNGIEIEVTPEQANQFRTKEHKPVIYSEKKNEFIKNNITIEDISEERKTESGTICYIEIGFSSSEAIDKNSVHEVLLTKNNVISIYKTLIQQDEKGHYVWKVENILRSKSDESDENYKSSGRTPEALINPQKAYIETGISYGNIVEITKGLSEGDIIARVTE